MSVIWTGMERGWLPRAEAERLIRPYTGKHRQCYHAGRCGRRCYGWRKATSRWIMWKAQQCKR